MKIIDRVLSRLLGKGKRKLTNKEIQIEEDRLKKAKIVVEARRLKEEKEQKQREREEALQKSQSPRPEKGKTIPK